MQGIQSSKWTGSNVKEHSGCLGISLKSATVPGLLSHCPGLQDPQQCLELHIPGGIWALQRGAKEGDLCLLPPIGVLDKIKSHISRIGVKTVTVCLPGYQDLAWWCSMPAAHSKASRYCVRDASLLPTLPRCLEQRCLREPLICIWVQFVNFGLNHFCQSKLNLLMILADGSRFHS